MQRIDLDKSGPLIVVHNELTLAIVPIRPYNLKGRTRKSNIRIFTFGKGGLKIPGSTMTFKEPFYLLRLADSDGTPTDFDSRIPTAYIELEPFEEEES